MYSEEQAIHAWARRKLARVLRDCTLRAADQFDAWARRLRRRVKEEGGRS